MDVTTFIRDHFHHFNAGALRRAAESHKAHVEGGGKVLVSIAGALSTAQIGRSLAEMIRAGQVHAISCTGANLEEDVFSLLARHTYVPLPNYRELTPSDESSLYHRGLYRVTDVCIPEDQAVAPLEEELCNQWVAADHSGERLFPHEFLYRAMMSDVIRRTLPTDRRASWVVAAGEHNVPIFVPGWGDSTLGNAFAGCLARGEVGNPGVVRSDVEYLVELGRWYRTVAPAPTGFLQLGGGIAGDFAICVVPYLRQQLELPDVPCWNYYCQIGDSTTSYGSYSGAEPSEKISWGKLCERSSYHMIESDATIVAPLLFAYVLGW